MASTTRSYHRRIGEEQWRSICQNCFLTAAEADCEEGLKEGEKAHICGESLLDREDRITYNSPFKAPAAIDQAALSKCTPLPGESSVRFS